MSQSKLSKIETMVLLPSVADVEVLCRAYTVPAAVRCELVGLVEDLREEQSRRVILSRGVAAMQRRIGELERSTSWICGFQPHIVIGLVQTPAYLRRVFSQPDAGLSEREIDDAVAARLERQALLNDESKRFTLVMAEGALRWQAGGPEVMAEQCDYLAELTTARPNVELGIVPWTVPVDFFPPGGFHLYDDQAAIVGTEIATMMPTGRADVAAYRTRFDAVTRVALFGEAARPHFERVAAEYRSLGDPGR